jgi:hypothetical protein
MTSTFVTQTRVELDEQWVEDLLVTAFDKQHGGCNYWLSELAHTAGPEHLLSVHINGTDEKWTGVTLYFEHVDQQPLTAFNGGRSFVHLGELDGVVVRTVSVLGAHLEAAWAELVDTRPIRSDLVEQLLRSQQSGDLDVDADAADCLVQYALFGQVVYG